MAKRSPLLFCASNRNSLSIAVTLLFLLLVGGLLFVIVRWVGWNVPYSPVFPYTAHGVIYNKLTGERLDNSQIECGNPVTTSDVRGRFVVDLAGRKSRQCQFYSQGFEPLLIDVVAGQVMNVPLVPDPVWTLSAVIAWEKQRKFGKQYDLLHTDVRRSWSREEFIRLLSMTESPIVDFEHAPVFYLDHWDNHGDIYFNVAVVPVWITFAQGDQHVQYYWESHWVKQDGYWRWFREPMTRLGAVNRSANAATHP